MLGNPLLQAARFHSDMLPNAHGWELALPDEFIHAALDQVEPLSDLIDIEQWSCCLGRRGSSILSDQPSCDGALTGGELRHDRP